MPKYYFYLDTAEFSAFKAKVSRSLPQSMCKCKCVFKKHLGDDEYS